MAIFLALISALSAWALSVGLGRWGHIHARRIRKRDRGRPLPGEPTRLWLSWWVIAALSGLAGGLFLGHPLVGLTLTALFPLARFFLILMPRKKSLRHLESSSLAFFHGLQGLLRAGFSFPSALFRLSESNETPFALLLKGSLAGFEQGKTLSGCLDRFQYRSGLSQAGFCLDLLEEAHGRGLGLVPFLDRVLPWLEEEARERERMEKVRAAAFAQAALAAALPWAVVVLAVGSPFLWSSTTWWLAGLGLGLQVAGFWVVGWVARFE